MIKYALTALTVASMALSSCSTTGGFDPGTVTNSPEFKAILAQIEQFALQFAFNYIMTHYGATRTSIRSEGVAVLKAEIIAKYHVSDQLAQLEAVAAFGKVK